MMATQPPISPDTIEPQSPDESPSAPLPSETPTESPDEMFPPQPDRDAPGRGPDEMPVQPSTMPPPD
jgi:hypothetical protein